jgi:hypothetical protein
MRWLSIPVACALFWQSLIAEPQGRLQVTVISGDNEDNGPPGSLSRNPIVLQVDGPSGPVASATIALSLPASGASGVFENGQTITTLTTGPDGRVSFRIRRNRIAGVVIITATASYAGLAPATINITRPSLRPLAGEHQPMKPLVRAMVFSSLAASATVGILFGTGAIQGNPTHNLPKTTVTVSTPTGPATPVP